MIKEHKKSSLGKIITLVIILLIPGLLHLYLRQTGENTYKALPFLGKNGSKEITTIHPFQLLDSNNETVNFPERNSITVVNFMHINCDAFGNIMNSAMEKVAVKFGTHPMVDLYSISLDSSDTPALLKEYSKHYNSSLMNWQFLTGSNAETSRIAREEFFIDGFQDAGNNKVIHSPFFVLLDSKQQIRGYYEFFTKDEVDRLIGEMILLITEESRKNGNKNI